MAGPGSAPANFSDSTRSACSWTPRASDTDDDGDDDRDRGVLTTDGVHLNAAGNRFVADRLLEAFGVVPR